MRKLALILVLGAVSVSAAAQTQQQSQGKTAQPAAQVKKDGSDCSPQKAGVRCSRPKPKKVWFWGKA